MPATKLLHKFTSEFGDLEAGADIARFLEGVSSHYGFRYFSVALLPLHEKRRYPKHNVVTNWPTDLIALFEERDLIDNGPLLTIVRSTTVPFVYSITNSQGSEGILPGGDDLNEIMKRYDIGYNAVFPTCDNRGNRACVSFSGNRTDLSTEEFLQLFMISTYFYDRLTSITRQQAGQESPLSQRELECLRWSAEGKTSSEISQIMSLSEHTINYYLVSAARKLDAVNRIQAVAQSIREGWI